MERFAFYRFHLTQSTGESTTDRSHAGFTVSSLSLHLAFAAILMGSELNYALMREPIWPDTLHQQSGEPTLEKGDQDRHDHEQDAEAPREPS